MTRARGGMGVGGGLASRLTANICCHLLVFAGVFRIMVGRERDWPCLVTFS